MKKVLWLIVCLMTMVLSVNAEEKVSEYTQSYFSMSFDIEASAPKNNTFTFFVNCASMENAKNDVCGFMLDSDRVNEFINNLNLIKNKFVEWTNTAKNNNVVSFSKEFDINFKSLKAYFKYGRDYHFSKFTFKPYFMVTKDGKCVAVFVSGKITASDNQFMDYDGICLTFTSANEFDDFIKALDTKNVLNKAYDNKVKKDLFK